MSALTFLEEFEGAPALAGAEGTELGGVDAAAEDAPLVVAELCRCASTACAASTASFETGSHPWARLVEAAPARDCRNRLRRRPDCAAPKKPSTPLAAFDAASSSCRWIASTSPTPRATAKAARCSAAAATAEGTGDGRGNAEGDSTDGAEYDAPASTCESRTTCSTWPCVCLLSEVALCATAEAVVGGMGTPWNL